jgi:hypothetical protein
MPGRPSSYSEAIASKILKRLATGEPMILICRDKKMPNLDTIFHWESVIEGFSEKVTRARERTADVMSYEVQEIADTPQIGEIITEKPVLDEDGTQMYDKKGRPLILRERKKADMIEHRKLRINTRFKLMGMLNRKKYGERPTEAQAGQTLIVPMPTQYIEAVNRALGYTGELKPLGSGEVIEGEAASEFLPE